MFDDVLKHRSGRVIALGRAMLAALFLFAIWIDPTQPGQGAHLTYGLLILYVVIAVGIAAAVWNDWWLDARLAAPAHALDMIAFALLVFATNGYTSPFFLFFVFLILSAAIRWGMRETAITAGGVTLLFLGTGLAGAFFDQSQFELQRFIIRSAHLLILSAILIWFGVNQGFSGIDLPRDRSLPDPALDEPPLETALATIMPLTGAAGGVLLWRKPGFRTLEVIENRGGRAHAGSMRPSAAGQTFGERSFLFRIAGDRGLTRSAKHQMHFFPASAWLDRDLVARVGVTDGLAVPITTELGSGQLLLTGISGLCTDHIDLGDRIADWVSGYIERHALLAAVNDTATARARLSLSRDLHDSIVQFLAGATFRVEAIARALRSGATIDRDLRELKQLLLEEQQELRSAIGALRRNSITLPALAADLSALCERLARQWDIACNFHADVPDVPAPMRLHLDTHQLIRETVANAVRHAGASSIAIALSSDDENLILEVSNEGFIEDRAGSDQPWSLRERVDEANGTLMLAARENRTTVSVTLPLKEERPL